MPGTLLIVSLVSYCSIHFSHSGHSPTPQRVRGWCNSFLYVGVRFGARSGFLGRCVRHHVLVGVVFVLKIVVVLEVVVVVVVVTS